MIKFEIGKEYSTKSMCDDDCIYKIKVIKRTDKTVVINEKGEILRKKIYFYGECEYIRMGNYSMVPVFYAK